MGSLSGFARSLHRRCLQAGLQLSSRLGAQRQHQSQQWGSATWLRWLATRRSARHQRGAPPVQAGSKWRRVPGESPRVPVVKADPRFRDSLVVVAHSTDTSRMQWAQALRAAGLQVRVWPDDGLADLDRVEFAVVWGRHPELWKLCPQLKAVQVMGAGVDSQLEDESLPRELPLLRVIDPLMAERMATWIQWGVINTQRKCDAYWRAQQERRWAKDIENFRSIDNAELSVGIMGLGVMGGAAADLLSEAGYAVSAWTRTPHDLEGVTCYSGPGELQQFVSGCNVLICLLPLTPCTRGIINAELLSWLPPGATLINAARGGHVVEADLLAALDGGQLEGATLDVFESEPLPPESPLWAHPHVRIFPHVSSMTNIDTAVEQIVHNRQCVLSNQPAPKDLVVDWALGY